MNMIDELIKVLDKRYEDQKDNIEYIEIQGSQNDITRLLVEHLDYVPPVAPGPEYKTDEDHPIKYSTISEETGIKYYFSGNRDFKDGDCIQEVPVYIDIIKAVHCDE